MLLIANLVLIGLIALALWVAVRRGRSHTNRSRAARAIAAQADLIPARPVGPTPPRLTTDGPSSPATWSASRERGDPEVPEGRVPAAQPSEPAAQPSGPAAQPSVPVSATNGQAPIARPAVLVVPRGSSWVVRRDGAARVSSVHATREAAEERARKTARRERVVLEVRDAESELLDRTDYSASAGAEA